MMAKKEHEPTKQCLRKRTQLHLVSLRSSIVSWEMSATSHYLSRATKYREREREEVGIVHEHTIPV
eukprot:scaffold1608_cov140-Skeletonema_dohrnii-CCMP3373.AAC.1